MLTSSKAGSFAPALLIALSTARQALRGVALAAGSKSAIARSKWSFALASLSALSRAQFSSAAWGGGAGERGAQGQQLHRALATRTRAPSHHARARLLCVGRPLHAALKRYAAQVVDKQRRASAQGKHAGAGGPAALLVLLVGRVRRLQRVVDL